jgi:uncharacterized membrane protein YidH (DUF202 family)
MVDDQTPKFDPRFSPAFQRGFDGEVDVAAEPVAQQKVRPPAPTAAPTRVVAAPLAPSPRAPTPPRNPLPPTALVLGQPVSAPASQSGPGAEPLIAPGAARTGTERSTEAAPSLRNPFIVALCVIAIALLVAGIAIFARTSQAFNDPGNVRSQGDYESLSTTLAAAPMLVLLGVATAIGVLFVFAVRWRSRK